MEFPLQCPDPAAMREVGRTLAGELGAGGVIALEGELGAGKTELVKGLAEGLGVLGAVTSPTFTLLQEYRAGKQTLYHFDFYRVTCPEEILDLGWDELMDEPGSVLAVEWASKFPELIPADAIVLQLEILGGGGRRILRRMR